ncbi:MAG: MFS transporter [Eggerthellaceae bacterium]|nr:MFS transporter [Eggerthellaceae bacterium]
MGWLPFIAFGLISCCLYGVGAGLRGDVGILLNPLSQQTGLSYESVSFCVAAMQLVFGASQPAFGILANRTSSRLVLVLGALLFAASLLGMRASVGFASLFLSLSGLFGLGAGAVSFGLILTSSVNFVGKSRAMAISGMLNAAAGMGSFALSPLLGALVQSGGLGLAVAAMLAPVLALIPIALVVTSRDKRAEQGESGSEERLELGPLMREALGNRTFLLLVAGFTTCGFHMVIIESHLFSQYVSYGIDAQVASWVFSLYGVFTIFGALLSGWLSTRVAKGRLLAFYYVFRALWVLAFIFLSPKTALFAALFSAGLGMTGDATVSPTSGLVSREFSFSKVATLIGVLFFCHQVGAFASAWLGGALFSATGSYTSLWLLDAALCLAAGVASAAIPEARPALPR